MNTNLILNTDSYKASHFLQYPEGTETVYSYIEARGCDDHSIDKCLFFGLQMFIKEYLSKPITIEDVEEAKDIFESHGEPFNYDGWKYIVEHHNGYLPIEIEAVSEGTLVHLNNVLVQVHNTDKKVPWLTSYVETMLLRAIWYPVTVATNSYNIKQDLIKYAKHSGSDLNSIDFKLHDFGARGVSSNESAMIGGIAHLVNFFGTDTVASLVAGRKYYHENMIGYSIPAAEHSTITVWGDDAEVAAYRNMLKQFAKPGSLVAVVSDSYNIFNAASKIWGEILIDEVRGSGATIVVRPDSGNPTIVPIQVIELLMEKYGFSMNEKGYRTLPNCIRVIQGDGINRKSIQKILENLDKAKLTLDNIAFGMGGALLQHVSRDDLKFAMKASYAVIDSKGRNVFKKPIGDTVKSSKSGILALDKMNHRFVTRPKEKVTDNCLRTVFKNGQLLIDETLSEIRQRTR